MKNPVHVGRLVREDCIDVLALTVSAAAQQLGITRQTLRNLISEKSERLAVVTQHRLPPIIVNSYQ